MPAMRVRTSLRSIFGVFLGVAMLCFALRWCLGPVVSPIVLRRLKPGMTADAVVQVLGEPIVGSNGEWFDDAGRFHSYSEERAFP
jgi:hypothetical protein